jgi:hypothetical protein
MAVTSSTGKRFVREFFFHSRNERLAYFAKNASRRHPVRFDHCPNDDFETVGRLLDIARAEFLFSALDFLASSPRRLVNFAAIRILAWRIL